MTLITLFYNIHDFNSSPWQNCRTIRLLYKTGPRLCFKRAQLIASSGYWYQPTPNRFLNRNGSSHSITAFGLLLTPFLSNSMTKILCRTLAYSRSWKDEKIPQAGSSRRCVRLMYYKLEVRSCMILSNALCEREKGITTLLCLYNYFICLDPQCVGSCKIHPICMKKN